MHMCIRSCGFAAGDASLIEQGARLQTITYGLRRERDETRVALVVPAWICLSQVRQSKSQDGSRRAVELRCICCCQLHTYMLDLRSGTAWTRTRSLNAVNEERWRTPPNCHSLRFDFSANGVYGRVACVLHRGIQMAIAMMTPGVSTRRVESHSTRMEASICHSKHRATCSSMSSRIA